MITVVAPHVGRLASLDTALIPQATWDALRAEAQAESDDALEEARCALGAVARAVTVMRRHGPRVPQILEAAHQVGADLIVVGASGWRARVRRFLRIGLADNLARRAQCPVLVVPAERLT